LSLLNCFLSKKYVEAHGNWRKSGNTWMIIDIGNSVVNWLIG